jgi:hypothetical protein
VETMIAKYFYDEGDYQTVLKCLKGYKISEEEREAVFARLQFINQ